MDDRGVILGGVSIVTARQRIMEHVCAVCGAEHTELGSVQVYSAGGWVWLVDAAAADGLLDTFGVQWQELEAGQVSDVSVTRGAGVMELEFDVPLGGPVATLTACKVRETATQLRVERHTDADCPPLDEMLLALANVWPDEIGRLADIAQVRQMPPQAGTCASVAPPVDPSTPESLDQGSADPLSVIHNQRDREMVRMSNERKSIEEIATMFEITKKTVRNTLVVLRGQYGPEVVKRRDG